MPSANGMKSLSQRACSACAAAGSMSSAASASANAIVESIAMPVAKMRRADERDQREHAVLSLGCPQHLAHISEEEDQRSAGDSGEQRRDLYRVLVVDVVVDDLLRAVLRLWGLAAPIAMVTMASTMNATPVSGMSHSFLSLMGASPLCWASTDADRSIPGPEDATPRRQPWARQCVLLQWDYS